MGVWLFKNEDPPAKDSNEELISWLQVEGFAGFSGDDDLILGR